MAHTATAAEIMSQKVEKKHCDDSFCNAEKVYTLVSKFMPKGLRRHGTEKEEADFSAVRDCTPSPNMARHTEVQCEAGDGRQEHRMHETWPEKYVQDLHCKGGSHNVEESCDNEVDEQGH